MKGRLDKQLLTLQVVDFEKEMKFPSTPQNPKVVGSNSSSTKNQENNVAFVLFSL
jgi:hypothetical protein